MVSDNFKRKFSVNIKKIFADNFEIFADNIKIFSDNFKRTFSDNIKIHVIADNFKTFSDNIKLLSDNYILDIAPSFRN